MLGIYDHIFKSGKQSHKVMIFPSRSDNFSKSPLTRLMGAYKLVCSLPKLIIKNKNVTFITYLTLLLSFTQHFVSVADQLTTINTQKSYEAHLQGICLDPNENIYWSFTNMLVKTDILGQVVKEVPVDSHHGDLTFFNNRIYVAVNLGKFNIKGAAKSWMYVYDSSDLKLLQKHSLQEVEFGAGGVGFNAGRFLVVGGLGPELTNNFIYVYDKRFQFVEKKAIPSGFTDRGIQTICFWNNHWWLGCYNNTLIKLDNTLKIIDMLHFHAADGLEGYGTRLFLGKSDVSLENGVRRYRGVLRQISID